MPVSNKLFMHTLENIISTSYKYLLDIQMGIEVFDMGITLEEYSRIITSRCLSEMKVNKKERKKGKN